MEGRNQDFKKRLIARALSFSKKIIRLSDALPSKRSIWIITDQLIRSATSVGANIIEAQAASSKKDFTNFLNHALKSANESKYWLLLLKEVCPDSKNDVEYLFQEAVELAKILGSIISTLKNKKF